jgi:hypothetical protein
MMRTERAALAPHHGRHLSARSISRQLLLAVAPPPRSDTPTQSGWPRWLTPAYLARGATSRGHVHLARTAGQDDDTTS